MTRDLEDVFAAIDGALADEDLPDAMRWSPTPERVTDAPEPWHVEEPAGSYIEDTLGPLLDRMRADRERERVRERRHPRPYLADALEVARLEVHTDRDVAGNLTLVVAPDAETAARMFEQFAEVARVMGENVRRFAEAVMPAVRAVQDELRPLLERAGVGEGDGPDRIEQPFERALWAKARQGTGPDRQIQHHPRPRRHVL